MKRSSLALALRHQTAARDAQRPSVKQTRLLMGMPVTVEVVIPTFRDTAFDARAPEAAFDGEAALEDVFDYFAYVERTFSVHLPSSEISRINRGRLKRTNYSDDMRTVLRLCRQTAVETNGYFAIGPKGEWDPSGLVKGWAIDQAAHLLLDRGYRDFYVEAGGDVQIHGRSPTGEPWRVGIRNPFDADTIVKVLTLADQGIATSGTYVRGQHIRNPYAPGLPLTEIASLTIVGPNVYEADRFATAAFAMGRAGIHFVEDLPGFEGYMIDSDGIATMTSGFAELEVPQP